MTRPGFSMFNTIEGHEAMTDDIQDLIPWIRESPANAERLWCAFSNVDWKKGDAEFGLTFRGAGGYVGELYMGAEEYEKKWDGYMEFYLCGTAGDIHPHIFEFLTSRGWVPFADGTEIREPKEPHINALKGRQKRAPVV